MARSCIAAIYKSPSRQTVRVPRSRSGFACCWRSNLVLSTSYGWSGWARQENCFAPARTARTQRRCCCTIWQASRCSSAFFRKRAGSVQGRELRNGQGLLVGAGPGDPELLTVKAARLLTQAEVVFHDSLVSGEILRLINRD